MQIEKFKDLTVKAFKEIKQYQAGEKGIVKTGLPYFDDLFPVVNGSGYRADVNVGFDKVRGKTFRKLEDAILFYKVEKEKYAKILAGKWKGIIPNEIYEKLISFKTQE